MNIFQANPPRNKHILSPAIKTNEFTNSLLRIIIVETKMKQVQVMYTQ